MTTTTQAQLDQNANLSGQKIIQHLKAYIQILLQEQYQLSEIDIEALKQKVQSIIKITDGDEDTEGFQIFNQLLADVDALKVDNASNKNRLAIIESNLVTLETTLTDRINKVETGVKAEIDIERQRITKLSTTVTQEVSRSLAKDNAHDSAIEGLQKTTDNLSDALQAEATRATTRENENSTAIGVERGRVDTLNQTVQAFATRTNCDNFLTAFCVGARDELWAGRTMPKGLPDFSTVN